MPYFSVVIPLYNKEKYIQNTLESVLNQTFADFEIIIVNDGSTDNSEAIVKQFTDNRIRYYKTENQGVSTARNFGVEKSTSVFIALLDADDYWKHNHLEELHKLTIDFPNCGMYCSRYLTKISQNKHLKNDFAGTISSDYRGIIFDFFLCSLKDRIATCSSVAFSKKIFEHFMGFNTSISNGEDTELWIKIAIKYPIAITNKETAIYQFDLPKTLSKTKISNRKMIDLEQFTLDESLNESLKKFLNIYRIEYALHYRIEGNYIKSNQYLEKINIKTLPFKTRLLLKTPALFLSVFLQLKRKLKKIGVDFTVYH
jgi:glycosyltransferase involved in cell wall biosynthesis